MATLTTTVTESVVLNGALRGNTNSVATEGINNVFERIVTCAHSVETTVAVFAADPSTPSGSTAIDVNNVKYIRVTNLDEEGTVQLAIVGGSTGYIVNLPPGTSHILNGAEAVFKGRASSTPAFGSLEDLEALTVKPEGTSYNPQVSIFVAGV